jgi:hypothetical protein
MTELKHNGELARLMPVSQQAELKLTSATIACLSSVTEFAASMLSPLGAPMGKLSKVTGYCEPIFDIGREKSKDRPDGLIIVRNRKKTWTALVEAKVKNAVLDEKQIERYLDLAKQLGIDAVITISNQFAVDPSHTPISVPKPKTKHVALYHWSWSALQAEANIHLGRDAVDDPDQVYILSEYLRFLEHPSSGVLRFTSMSSAWPEAYQHIHRIGSLTKNSPLTIPLIDDWNELTRSICLSLGAVLNENVSMVLTRPERNSPATKIQNDMAMLIASNRLESTIRVPNAAADIIVTADLSTRRLLVSMQVSAPGDKKMAKSSINWALKQIDHVEDPSIELNVNWPGRKEATCRSVPKALADAIPLYEERAGLLPSSFVVRLNVDLAGRFTQRKNFPIEVAQAVIKFYTEAGQNLTAWQPKPPQLKKKALPEALEALELKDSSESDTNSTAI